ncbi:hypothetical protein C8R45DRAFT_533707 [Mycena sanguinolenta]|nr:hypothetical protein C8R45DRAFT_533707 [Mycena sanguinolenta]
MDPVGPSDSMQTLAPLEIGVLLSYLLFGVATMQLYVHFGRFPDDSRKFKGLVLFVWIFNGVRNICLGQVLYSSSILRDTNPDRVGGPRSLAVSMLFSEVTVGCVQGFFAFRIYTFTKKVYIPGLVWFMVFLNIVGRVALFAAVLPMAPELGTFLTRWEWLITLNWSISVLNDVLITTTLVVGLYGQRSHAHRRTAALVDKLIVWTIETGLLTSVASGLTLVCFVAMTQNYVWFTFYTIATALFPNSLMASLNSRATLRAMDQLSLPSVSLGETRQIQLPSTGRQEPNIPKEDICEDGY